MAEIIDIVNRALSKLGERRLKSLDDDAKAAEEAAGLYGVVRDAELAAHPWAFAKTRTLLVAEQDAPPFGFCFSYILPDDCLRVLLAGSWPSAVLSDYIGESSQSYTLENGRILTNQSGPLNVVYLRRVVDSNFYPPLFAETLAARLAVELAESLTGSNSKRELAWKEYENALRRARRWGAIQLPPEAVQDDSWLLARF